MECFLEQVLAQGFCSAFPPTPVCLSVRLPVYLTPYSVASTFHPAPGHCDSSETSPTPHTGHYGADGKPCLMYCGCLGCLAQLKSGRACDMRVPSFAPTAGLSFGKWAGSWTFLRGATRSACALKGANHGASYCFASCSSRTTPTAEGAGAQICFFFFIICVCVACVCC